MAGLAWLEFEKPDLEVAGRFLADFGFTVAEQSPETLVLRGRQAGAAHFGIPWPRYRLIGVAELAAAAGALTGLWWHPLGVAAAAGMALLLLGAVITHRRAADGGKETAPALLAPSRVPRSPT